LHPRMFPRTFPEYSFLAAHNPTRLNTKKEDSRLPANCCCGRSQQFGV
jgi:hypothetical protein